MIVECDPAPRRGGAPQLALPARPPHRRLRAAARAMARLTPASRNSSPPYKLGYRMPAEWEPHEATWLAWPHERTDWPGKFAPIPWVYADIVRHLARVERVRILVGSRQEEQRARRILKKAGVDLARGGFFPRAHQPRLDARLRPDLCQAPQQESGDRRSPIGTSTPGPNTTTGKTTMPQPAGSSRN